MTSFFSRLLVMSAILVAPATVACGDVVDSPPRTIHVPEGTFVMGTDVPVFDQPVSMHEVSVGAFEIDQSEVTERRYRECMDRGPCTAPMEDSSLSCNSGKQGFDDHPVNCVTHTQAKVYCDWRGMRLPTEEEWEYAARYDDGREFPWGNEPPDVTRFNSVGADGWGDDGYPGTAPVGSFPAGDSALGIHDFVGNVWEWTESQYCEYPALPCRSCPEGETCNDACARCSSPWRIMRGGAYSDSADAIYSFYWRGYEALGFFIHYLGFRCARSAQGTP